LPLKTLLVNPEDGKRQLVEGARSALVAVRPIPPFGAELDAVVFRAFLTDSAGSNDMTVLASPAAPALFSARAIEGADLYIKSMSFAITGTNMELGDFGDLAALTDPCILTYETESERIVLEDNITTNFELMRLGGELMPGVGDTSSALKVSSPVLGQTTNDLYLAYIDFSRVFGFQWGLRIAASSEQRLDFIIQEDLTLLPSFDCEIFGFVRRPDTERQ